MQKTKLGISVGLLAAIVYFLGLFSGYVATIVLVGYILIVEDNAWLKNTSVKAVVLMLGFSLVYSVLGLIPGLISFINSLVNIFGGSFYISFVTNVINMLENGIGLVQKIVFLGLGVMALNESTIKIPGLDALIDKYMD